MIAIHFNIIYLEIESESVLSFTPILRFYSVEMGNSLEQYRASIGLYNSGARPKRKGPDLRWVALTDLLSTVLLLQVLLAGLLMLQLHLYDQPWQPSPGYEEGGASIFFPVVGKVIINLESWPKIA